MRIVDRREAIQERISNFLNTYRGYSQDKPMLWTNGVPLGKYVEQVANLDAKTCDAFALGNAIGKPGIVENNCDECGKDFDKLIRIGEEPDYDARWQDLCVNCLSAAIAKLSE